MGQITLESGDRSFVPERKTAALLTYLALEGPTTRLRLAALLWPDVAEATARNNLSQLLRRLRGHTGEVLVPPGEPLRIEPDVDVDAAQVKIHAFAGAHDMVLTLAGPLLPHVEYDDLPEFSEWLYAERERFAALRREARLAEAERLERAGDLGAAVLLVEEVLRGDAIAEDAYGRLMRLHHLAGDRHAALRTYARCEDALRKELDLEPLPETTALARQIAGDALEAALPRSRPVIPLAIQRPPVLAGRERAWTELQDAWEAGRPVFVQGPAGVGKTRLLTDFANAFGRLLAVPGRPGDRGVPYASITRGLRTLLQERPDVATEPWIRRELTRLVPELSSDRTPPIASEMDKLHFYDAVGALLDASTSTHDAIVLDDIHTYDDGSFELAAYLASRSSATPGTAGPRFLFGYRPDELSPVADAAVRRTLESGSATFVTLEPLTPEEIAVLLAGLAMPTLAALHAPLARYTGGNPLYIVETLKSLAELDRLDGSFPADLPPPGRVGPLITARLERLTPGALRLAITAAIAADRFDPEIAGALLRVEPLDLTEPWAELERAHILKGGRFTHDLVREAVERTTPEPVRALLHRRYAHALERSGAPNALVAKHHLDAGDRRAAVPFLLAAGADARQTFRLLDAAAFLEHAATLLEEEGRDDEAFDAWLDVVEMVRNADDGTRIATAVEHLARLARGPARRARLAHVRSEYVFVQGDGANAEALAREGHADALQTDDLRLQKLLLQDVAVALWMQERHVEAGDVFRDVLAIAERIGDPDELSMDLANYAVLLDHQERHHEALVHHQHAAAIFEARADLANLVVALNNASISHAELGDVHASIATLERALEFGSKVDGIHHALQATRLLLGASYLHLPEYTRALEHLDAVLASHDGLAPYILATCLRHRARLAFELGAPDEARQALERALAQEPLPDQHRGRLHLLRASLSDEPDVALEDLAEAARLFGTGGRKLLEGNLLVERAAHLPPDASLDAARAARDIARTLHLDGLRIAAETRCAQALLALQCPTEARSHSSAAMEYARSRHSLDFYHGHVLLTHLRALEATDALESREHLRASIGWLTDVARHRTPDAYRRSFLLGNRTNRELTEAARDAGLEIA
jgi:DNA-binding SARP family transcriptional activator